MIALAQAAANVQINRYNFETIDLLRRSVVEWSREYAVKSLPAVTPYVIEVGFDQLTDETERRSFGGIPTTYDLPDVEVDRLRRVGQRILVQSSDFNECFETSARRVMPTRVRD